MAQKVCPLLSSQFSKCWHVSMWLIELLWFVARWDYLQKAIMKTARSPSAAFGTRTPFGAWQHWVTGQTLLDEQEQACPHPTAAAGDTKGMKTERDLLYKRWFCPSFPPAPLQTHTNNSCLPRRKGERTMSKCQTECLFHAGSTATSKLFSALIN